jgi:hypothetical protein
MQCFQSIATVVGYTCKMSMKLTPDVVNLVGGYETVSEELLGPTSEQDVVLEKKPTPRLISE